MISYNLERLENYQPNQTFWLKDQHLHSLNEANIFMNDRNPQCYEHIWSSFVIDLIYASSCLENINISFFEMRTLLEYQETPDNLSPSNLQFIRNHQYTIHYIKEHLGDFDLTAHNVYNIRQLLQHNLPYDEPAFIDDNLTLTLNKAKAIHNPHEQAFFVITMLSYLQFFTHKHHCDARLIMNIPYLKNNLIPFSFYGIKKSDYYNGLHLFYRSNNVDIFADLFTHSYTTMAHKYNRLLQHVYQGGIIATLG